MRSAIEGSRQGIARKKQGFVARMGISSRVFLIQARGSEGGREFGARFYGISEVFLGGREAPGCAAITP